MNLGNKLSLVRRERDPGGVKAERTHYSVNHNPSTLQSGGMLLVKIPALAPSKLLVPGSMKLVFNINITGDTNSWFINNLAANLITRVEVKWGTKSLLNINNFDVLQNYRDLWLTSHQRLNLVRRGIQSPNLSKLRSGASSALTTDANEVRLNRIFGNRYEIPLDFSFLTDQHPFYPYIYKEDVEIDLYFQKASLVINSGTTTVVTDYNLSNICLEYDSVCEPQVANQIAQMSDSSFGITYFYDYISFLSMNPINQSDLSFTLTVQDPRRSVRGILMLFTQPPATANRTPENYFNPEITNVDITIDGITNKIFAQGYKEDKMYFEARKLFLKEDRKLDENSGVTLLNFYGTSTISTYCMWIDMRSTEDNKLHGSGMKIPSGSNVALKFTKNNTGTGTINVYAYLVADAQFTLTNRFAMDPQY
jgi:hypothetical protein